MRRNLYLTLLGLLCFLINANTQSAFDPNDALVNYSPSNPPATPPADTLVKWVRTPRPEVPFNAERFKAYYYNGMAFRLRFPNGYNPNDPNKKYPVILFFHGIGETGPVTDNDIQLAWGAQYFETKINEGQFDAFLLFPLTSIGDWQYSFNNINSVLDLLQINCHADPDRLITMGLSLGGDGTMQYAFTHPQRAAVSIPSSPGSISLFTQNPAPFIHIPFWIASGGMDAEFANPAAVQQFVDRFNNNGGHVRWTYYPDRGHGTWPYHWYESFLVPYWQAAHKSNPIVFFKQNEFPPNAAINARIGITGGFAEYQWQRNLIDMPGANSNEIVVNQTGSYRVRFKRFPGSNFSEWSPNPAVISQPSSPDISAPTAPVNLRVVSSGTNSITLDWDNSTDNVAVTGYDVFVDGTKKYSTTNSEIIADNLNPGTTYTFTVQAHDLANNFSAFSNAANGTTSNVTPPGDNTPPSAPGNLRVVSSGTNSVSLDWDNSVDNVGVAGYDIFVNNVRRYSSTNSEIVADNLNPATTYSFTVQAHDQAGNYSAFSNAVNGTTSNTGTPGGLTYKFYQGSFNTLPNFNALTPVSTGSSPNVNIGVRPAGVNDNFAFIWEGNISITTPGTFIFETVSDDGSKLYFNTSYSAGATALVNNDGLHGATSATGTVNITAAGSYPIAITFFELNGGETMEVYWSGPGFGRQLIPNSAFTGGTQPQPGNGLNYKYFEGSFSSLPNFNSLTPVKTGTSQNVDLGARNPGVNDNFAFIWEGNITITTPGTYTFETISDDGSKLYFNTSYSAGATAIVNNDGLHAPTSATGIVNIPAAGSYPIAITFFEQGGGEVMEVYWSGPGIGRQLIPNSAFGNGGNPQPVAGLHYKYYEGSWSVLPNFNSLTPVKTGSSTTPDIGTRNPGVNDNFAFVWEGNINITTPGTYTFETISDDGSKLYFNSLYSPGATALVNNDGLHAAISATGSVTVAAGTYPIAITFFEQGGGETMQVYWSGPGIPRQLIPASAFTANSNPPSATGLNYKYYEGFWSVLPNFNSLTPVKTGTGANADIGARNPGVNDNFGFVWEGYINITTPGNYTFETVSDDGSRLYFNSMYSPGATALVNNDGLHPAIPATGSVNIPAAGLYPIAITYFEQGGGESMQVYWSGPGIGRQLIPNSAFRLNNTLSAGVALSQNNDAKQLSAERENVAAGNIIVKHIYPNPFAQIFIINFYNSSAANKINVDLFDVSGRVIYNKYFGNTAAGNTLLKVDAGAAVKLPGIYFVRLRINDKPSKLMKLVRSN